ncbi:MAG: FlgO family outer membrane protein [Victivallales bacterium]
MGKTCLSLLAAAVLCASMVAGLANSSSAKSLDEEIPSLAGKVSKQLMGTDGKKMKIAILDVLNLQGQQNELGRSIAEQMSVELVIDGNVSVVDRANIDRIMTENKFARTLANSDDIKKLGKIAGLDAIAIGSVNCNDTTGELIIKVISIETAELLAAGRCKFDMTQDLMKQFNTAINCDASVSGNANNTGNETPSSQESKGIAKKSFGNLEVVLKTVTPTTVEKDRNNILAIRCSFELYNRDLNKTIVIAVNGEKGDRVREIDIHGYRGELSDSNGRRWSIPVGMIKGVSAVLCCDATRKENPYRNWGAEVAQNNPSAVVDYIKNGKRCEIGDSTHQEVLCSLGKFWTGSFSPIPPGKSIRITVDFTPAGRENSREDKIKFPQSFKYDMELVIGTITTGEVPGKAKDLKLENLTFDKIIMPTRTEKSNQ